VTAFVIYDPNINALIALPLRRTLVRLVILFSLFLSNYFFMQLLTPEFGLLTWSLFLLGLIFMWVIALADILRHEFQGSNEKLIWVLVVIFMPFLGSLLYFIIGRQNRIKHNQY
jgi:hypothetical protein